jgi:3-oxoacyl-[acyl-carrier protein] reductase
MSEHAAPLDGRITLVTGASSGIGAAVALAAAAAGSDVGVAYHGEKDRADEVVARIGETGHRAEAFAADLADPSQARAMVGAVEQSFGRVDALVNNAGIMPETGFLDISDEEWDRVIRTDLGSAFACTQAVIPGMVERGSGAVVMISSRLGQIGWPRLVHYAAAKSGMLGMAKSLAREFGPAGIRVNAVAPGVTLTDMAASAATGDEGRRRLAEIPAGRFATPEDVAATVVFLLSDQASMYHGQTLCPNGGGFMP